MAEWRLPPIGRLLPDRLPSPGGERTPFLTTYTDELPFITLELMNSEQFNFWSLDQFYDYILYVWVHGMLSGSMFSMYELVGSKPM